MGDVSALDAVHVCWHKKLLLYSYVTVRMLLCLLCVSMRLLSRLLLGTWLYMYIPLSVHNTTCTIPCV